MRNTWVCCGLLLNVAGWAAPVVINGDFEAPMLVDGEFTPVDDVPIAWTVTTGQAGIFNPTTGQYAMDQPLTAPAGGDQVAYANGGHFCQDVGGTIRVGNTYTLTVAVGRRLDLPFPGYTIELRATTSNALKASSSAANPAPGAFVTDVASFTAVPDADTGDSLTVCLTSINQQTNFDNVELTPVELESFSIE